VCAPVTGNKKNTGTTTPPPGQKKKKKKKKKKKIPSPTSVSDDKLTIIPGGDILWDEAQISD